MPTARDGKPNLEKVEVFRKVWEEMRAFATTTVAAYPSATPFARFGAFAHVRARARHNAGTRADLKSDNVEAYFACLHGRSEEELDTLSYEAEPKVQHPSPANPASPVRAVVPGRNLKDYNAADAAGGDADPN